MPFLQSCCLPSTDNEMHTWYKHAYYDWEDALVLISNHIDDTEIHTALDNLGRVVRALSIILEDQPECLIGHYFLEQACRGTLMCDQEVDWNEHLRYIRALASKI